MDFLASAIYTSCDNGGEKLSGAMLTHFDPSDMVARAQVFYVTVDQLKSDSRIIPSGFHLDEDGILLSDTQSRSILSLPMTKYVEMELGNSLNRTPISLLDIVLYAAKYDGHVFVNSSIAAGSRNGVEDEDPILIPMRSFRVSNSSFNIYAPYRRSDNTYRTFSLVDIETNLNVPFVLAVPHGDLANYAPVISFMDAVEADPRLPEFRLFKVDAPLAPFYAMAGEGFINYLAYNVASCSIGLQVIKEFLAETGYVSTEQSALDRDRKPLVRKTPKANVVIESSCKTARTGEVLACLTNNNLDRLKELMLDEEAYITFIWLKKVFDSSAMFAGKSQSDSMAAACMSLQRECKDSLLHYAIELLAQRLYIYSLGILQDPYGPVLKGGGVNGYGFKRFVG